MKPTHAFRPGEKVYARLTTDEFRGEIVRELTPDEVDWDDVGPMYVLAIHVYEDELTREEKEER